MDLVVLLIFDQIIAQTINNTFAIIAAIVCGIISYGRTILSSGAIRIRDIERVLKFCKNRFILEPLIEIIAKL